MEDTIKEEKGPFKHMFDMASEMAQLELLGDIKTILEKISEKDFYSFEKDKVKENTYHILHNEEHLYILKTNDVCAVVQYVELLQYGFNHGCGYVLETLVKQIEAKTLKK